METDIGSRDARSAQLMVGTLVREMDGRTSPTVGLPCADTGMRHLKGNQCGKQEGTSADSSSSEPAWRTRADTKRPSRPSGELDQGQNLRSVGAVFAVHDRDAESCDVRSRVGRAALNPSADLAQQEVARLSLS